MELALVKDLCGIFCFSMQFVVLMDLLGTAVLPGGLLVTYYLIYMAIYNAFFNPEFFSTNSGVLQIIITGSMVFVTLMPAILVILTGKKTSYVIWMFIYFASLPVWQFILPIYAYWHFDDFSWGETRKVEGTAGNKHHDEDDGVFDSKKITMKRWEEYQSEWERNFAAEP